MSLKTLLLVARTLNCRFIGGGRWKSTRKNCASDKDQNPELNAEQKQRKGEEKDEEADLPPEPTSCCMSGCANCVWIKYAQELAQLFDNGDVIAKKKISEKVCDPNLRAYLFNQLGLKEGDEK